VTPFAHGNCEDVRVIQDDESTVAPDGPGRLPDHDLDAEQRVLAQMLASKDVIATVATHLRASDFARGYHRVIYAAILALHSSGETADPGTLSARLIGDGQPADKVPPYISALTATAPSARLSLGTRNLSPISR
jgi:replicative DNA helicase